MRQVSNKYWIISIDDGLRFLTEYRNTGKVRIVDNIGDAMQFTDPYLALEKGWKKWYKEVEFTNYALAPRFLEAEIEQIDIARKIVKVTAYPAQDAKAPRVINDEQLKHKNMWGHPDDKPSDIKDQPHLYSTDIK